MDDAQPVGELVNRWQGLLESLPFLSDNTAAKVCRCLQTAELGLNSAIKKHKIIIQKIEFSSQKIYDWMKRNMLDERR